MTVLLDAGHGGTDHGAVRHSIREADIALRIAKMIKKISEKHNGGIEVIMSRSKDTTIPLKHRIQLAKHKKANLIVSIHLNASESPLAHGFEVYFQNQLEPSIKNLMLANKENQVSFLLPSQSLQKNTELDIILSDLNHQYRVRRSLDFSRTIVRNWSGGTKVRSNSIRQAPFYIVTQAHVPSVLVELGFLSNPKDHKSLTNTKSQFQFAKNIYKSLLIYKNEYH